MIGKAQKANGRAVGVMRKLGATVVEETVRNGRAEYVWTIEKSTD